MRWCSLYAAIVLLATGCAPMASIAWSSDGRRAVYAVQHVDPRDPTAAAWVIDDTGRTVADLGPIYAGVPMLGGVGPAAWAGDAAFYFVAPADGDMAPLAADWGGRPDPPPTTAPATEPAGQTRLDVQPAAVYRWADGKRQRLAPLGRRFPLDVQRSPDGRWLALLTTPADPQPTARISELYAYDLTADRLYRLSSTAGNGVCFTGPARVAYVERLHGSARGEIVEADLAHAWPGDPGLATPSTGVELLADEAGWLRPAADGLYFLARPATFPGRADAARPTQMLVGSVYHWGRQTKSIREIAGSAVAFAVSPDGHRLLTVTATPDANGRLRTGTVALTDADGTHLRTLGDASAAAFGLWPTWHGNGRVTRSAGPGTNVINPAGGSRECFDLIDESVDGGGPPKTLSTGWADDQRPAWTDPWQGQDIRG